MAIGDFPDANYTPTLAGYSGQGSFRFWCQTVLPLVYDDSLSYYELLNKVVIYLNNVISDVSNVETNVASLLDAYNSLQEYVNTYFDSLDVQEEINNKLDNMASDGSLDAIISPYIPDAVSDWLDENITPTTPAVDASLSVSGAAADAKVTGYRTTNNSNAIEANFVKDDRYYYPFENGYFAATNGNTYSSEYRIRSVFYLPNNLARLVANDGYCFSVYAWNNGTFVGTYNDGWVATTTKTYTDLNLLSIRNNYELKIVFRATENDVSITPSDYQNNLDFYYISGNNYNTYASGNTETTLDTISAEIYNKEVVSSSASGYYTLQTNGFNPVTGVNITSGKYLRTISKGVNENGLIFYMTTDDYYYTIYGNTTAAQASSTGTHSYTNNAFVKGTTRTFITADSANIRVCFARADGENMTFDDSDSTSDSYIIQRAMHYYTYALDTTLTEEGIAPDSKAVGDAIGGVYTLLNERTIIDDTPADFGYAFGGLNEATGRATTDETEWLRILNSDGLGGIPVSAVTVVTPNAGYTIKVLKYNSYTTGANFDYNNEWSGELTTPYTIEEDCFIRVCYRKIDSSDLWYIDDTGNHLTETGSASIGHAVSFSIAGQTVLNLIDNLRESYKYNTIIETTPVPNNALEYHALWQSLLGDELKVAFQCGVANSSGTVRGSKIVPLTGENPDDFPVYVYRLTINNYLNSSYGFQQWTGVNQLYDKPIIFITSGMHGNERATPMALYAFVNSLLFDTNFGELRDSFDWYFMPLVNPWGFSHTAVKNGNITNGTGYNYSTLSSYTVNDNNATHFIGIRRNAQGYDPNRCFHLESENNVTTLNTYYAVDDSTHVNVIESANVVEALKYVTRNNARKIALFSDWHQSYNEADTKDTRKCAFVGMDNANVTVNGETVVASYNNENRSKIFSKWAQASGIAKQICDNTYGYYGAQVFFPWSGTTSDASHNTARNTFRMYADICTTFETGVLCRPYSKVAAGLSGYFNKVAMNVGTTAAHYFMKYIAQLWL